MATFIDWLWDVLNHWQVLVSGGIITAVLTAAQARIQHSFSWFFTKWVFSIFLIIALFQSWRDKQGALDLVQKELTQEKDRSNPKLFAAIESTGLGQVLQN